MKGRDRSWVKTGIAGLVSLWNPSIGLPLLEYNCNKAVSQDRLEKNMEDGDIYIIYFDLKSISCVGYIGRALIPDSSSHDHLGYATNSKIAHAALEVYSDGYLHRFEVTCDEFGKELAKKHGVNASNTGSNSFKKNACVRLNYTKLSKSEVKDFIERRFGGRTKYSISSVCGEAIRLFKELGKYDLFLNNCQDFAEKLSKRIK